MTFEYFLQFCFTYLQRLPSVMLITKQTIQILLLNISPHNKNLSVTGQSFFALFGCSKLFDLLNEGSTVLELPNEANTSVGQWILLNGGVVAK